MSNYRIYEFMQFEESGLTAFIGCDGCQFNVIEFIKSFHTKKVTSCMRTIGNVLTTLSMAETL